MAQQCTMCSNPSSGRCTSCNCSAYCYKKTPKSRLADPQAALQAASKLRNATKCISKTKHLPQLVDKVTPEFVWVPTEWVPEKDEFTWGFENFKIKPYIGLEKWDSVRVGGNVIRSRKRENQNQLFMRDTTVDDGSLPNRTIAGLTKGVAFHPWCGSMHVGNEGRHSRT